MRDDFLHGKFHPAITGEDFRLRDYHRFLAGITEETSIAKARQQQAFEAERERWRQAGVDREIEIAEEEPPAAENIVPPGCRAINSPVHGVVWSVAVRAGDHVTQGQRLVIVESMKMEVAVTAPRRGLVVEVPGAQGTRIAAGQALVYLKPEVA
jgi:urea carboxylase